jgi:putative membrane protein
MWGCNFNGNMPFLGYFFSHGFFSLLLWGVILALVVVLISKILGKRSVKESNHDQIDSLELLKIRFAKGEIDKDDFQRMKQILTQS